MINPIHSGLNQSSTLSMINGGSTGMSETGEPDFWNYLLGLQIDSAEPDLDLSGMALNSTKDSGEVSDADRALLKLFDKKENEEALSLWGGVAMGQAPEMALTKDNMNLLSFVKSPMDQVPVQQMETNKGSRTTKNEGYSMMEDPLMKASFEAALSSKDSPGLNPLVNRGNFMRGISGQPKEKLIQAFKGLEKTQALPLETVSLAPKENAQVSFEELETKEVHEKSRKKSVDSLELAFDEVKGPSSEKVITNTPKETVPLKISHVPVPQVFQKVESMVHQGGGKMTLVLSPPELGQVEIHVSTKGKNVEVTVKSDNDFAKAAIEGQVADLQQSLQSQDLNLAKIEVHVTREMDPSFLENQFAGFNRQGNLYQNSEGYRQERDLGNSREFGESQMKVARNSGLQAIHRGFSNDSRVDIRI